MILEKYKHWPFAIIDSEGKVWRRSKTKGWFEFRSTNTVCSKYLTHPDFSGCRQITIKKDVPQKDIIR